jgi:PAS domain-containing protein
LENQATRILHRARRDALRGNVDFGELAAFIDELLIEIRSLDRRHGHGREARACAERSRFDLRQGIPLRQGTPVACVLTDESGRIRDINAQACQLLHVSARGGLKRSIVLFFADREQPRALLERLALGEPEVQWSGLIRPADRRPRRCTLVIQSTTTDTAIGWRWFFSVDEQSEPLAQNG